MSRSQYKFKGSGKGPGYEFWSRRPGNGSAGRVGKKTFRGTERMRAKETLRKDRSE